MVVMSNATKKELHDLVDSLPDIKVQAARSYLEFLRQHGDDPVLRSFREAPQDDEPETLEEAAAVQEARDAVARGDVLTDEEMRRELGL